jgi:hypothetical protein
VLKIYKEHAFDVLKKYRSYLGRRRLTRRLLYRLYRTDKQFLYFPDGTPVVVYDPTGTKLEEYLQKKVGVRSNANLQ